MISDPHYLLHGKWSCGCRPTPAGLDFSRCKNQIEIQRVMQGIGATSNDNTCPALRYVRTFREYGELLFGREETDRLVSRAIDEGRLRPRQKP